MFSLTSPLILASQSPRREQILRMLGFEFSILPADVDETIPSGMKAPDVPEALAKAKSLHVSREHPEKLVLGADTLVVLEDRVLGKPSGTQEALQMLSFLSGRTHQVYTGVALAMGGKIVGSGTACTEVTFETWNKDVLEAYVRGGESLDKAGAYAIQGQGAFLVQGIRGCFFNVMGLPIQKTLRLLQPYQRP